MHVPGAWPQDWDAPCLFHVLSKGKGLGVPAVLLPVLPVRKSKNSRLVTRSMSTAEIIKPGLDASQVTITSTRLKSGLLS